VLSLFRAGTPRLVSQYSFAGYFEMFLPAKVWMRGLGGFVAGTKRRVVATGDLARARQQMSRPAEAGPSGVLYRSSIIPRVCDLPRKRNGRISYSSQLQVAGGPELANETPNET